MSLSMLFLTAAALGCGEVGSVVAAVPPPTRTVAAATAVVPVSVRDVRLEWRYTRRGWLQIPVEIPGRVHLIRVPPQPVLIHPLVWSLATLLLVVAAATWAADEWQWDRLGSRSS